MSRIHGANVVRSGLVLHVDAANVKSYSGSGTNWSDLSGNAFDVNLLNGPAFANGSFLFDDTNDYAETADRVSLRVGTNAFSLEAWFRPTAVQSSIASKGAGATADTWLFHVNVSSNLIFTWTGSISTPITLNNWYHAVVSREGTGTDQTKIYVNGALAVSGTDSQNHNTTAPLRIGSNRTVDNFFAGNIAVFRMYNNKFLTETEVKRNFEASRSRYGI